ncbi:MAG: hypothetical protein ABIJ27_01950 [Candidatus Omnitrophota bacterium]
MREVVFKNMTSLNGRKKDTRLKEIFEKNGVLAKAERRYFYFVKEISRLENDQDLQAWMKEQNAACPTKKRHFHILKEHDNRQGNDRLLCKVLGTFYAVSKKKVYTIAFLHAFKVSFSKIEK